MDLTESIQPRSDQVNADDLIGGPITYTVRDVREGAAEQPIDIMLIETDRAYRPSKTMRRVIVAAWGSESSAYIGRRLTLYREPSIRFGKEEVGGIRISHMSGITGRVETKVQVSRGKREKFTVDPLPDAAPALTADDITGATDLGQLGEMWKHHPAQRAAIEARVAEIKAADSESPA